MAKNGPATLLDDNGLPIASSETGQGSGTAPPYGALCVTGFATPADGATYATPAGGTYMQTASGALYNGATYDRQRGTNGVAFTTSGGSTAVPVLTGTAGSAVIKASPGRVCRALVTTAGTSTDNLTIYDNASAASGTILAIILGGTTVGTVIDINMPAANGIYASNVASGPAITLSYV